MSISLLSLLVGHNVPATMGLNLRGLGLLYIRFLCFYGVFYLFGLVNFW